MANTIGDVVLIHINHKPAFFARIESINPDVKPDWWQVTLLVLQVPLKTLTWILREAYIDGDEYTMGGTPMKIEGIKTPLDEDHPEPPDNSPESADRSPKGQVISLSERRKK